jgi:glutamate dehydrogenase/leucine dehydrogenase
MPNFRGTICTADVDIYAPCAMGATIKWYCLQNLKKVIAGAANNQLADENIHFTTKEAYFMHLILD